MSSTVGSRPSRRSVEGRVLLAVAAQLDVGREQLLGELVGVLGRERRGERLTRRSVPSTRLVRSRIVASSTCPSATWVRSSSSRSSCTSSPERSRRSIAPPTTKPTAIHNQTLATSFFTAPSGYRRRARRTDQPSVVSRGSSGSTYCATYGQVPVPLVDVEAVADDEVGRDPEPHVAQVQPFGVGRSSRTSSAHTSRLAGARASEVPAQVREGEAGVDDVLDEEHVPARRGRGRGPSRCARRPRCGSSCRRTTPP